MIRAALRFALVLLLLVPAAHAAEFGDKQRAEIETIVRDYLIAHPEVLVEVSDALRAKQAEADQAKAREAVGQLGDSLFSSDRQVVLGNPRGDVTVVEFFDYNCGYCRGAMGDMLTLIKDDPNIRFVLKELVALGQPSFEAARVAVAVHLAAPDRYLAFHQALLGANGRADEAAALDAVASVGIDAAAIRARLDDPEVILTLQEVTAQANELGVSGTPAYVVGDEVLVGAQDFGTIREKIAALRSCGRTVC